MSGVCMGVEGVFVRESLCSHRQPAILLTTEGQMPTAVCAPASPATVYLTYGRQPDDTLKSSINDIQATPDSLIIYICQSDVQTPKATLLLSKLSSVSEHLENEQLAP